MKWGHCAVALFFGCPAFPAIRLDGHAVAIHRPQSLLLALIVWGVGRLWRLVLLPTSPKSMGRFPGGRWHYFIPLLAFTGAKEFFHLVGGHGGELIFATTFFLARPEWAVFIRSTSARSMPCSPGIYGGKIFFYVGT